MNVFWYVSFLILNMALIFIILRWRGLFSAEGLGMAFLALIVGSDALGLLVLYLMDSNIVNMGSEMELRFLPGIVLTVALLSFFCGLFISNPERKPLSLGFSAMDDKTLRNIFIGGFFLAFLGLSMKLYALYSWGFRTPGDYLAGVYMYQATKRGGGFMDHGVSIAILGLSLLVCLSHRSRLKQLMLLSGILAISFALTSSKSGINTAIIILLFTLSVFNRELLRRFLTPAYIFVFIAVLFISLGIKTELKYSLSKDKKPFSIGNTKIVASSVISIGRRYGPFGLYRGYSFMVTRLSEEPELFFGTNILVNTLTGWIPRFVWPDKPGHPFHARGDLTNEDSSIDIYGTEAPTFAGYGFADTGFPSLVVYSFIGGLMLGTLRKIMAANASYLFKLGYIFFSINMGGALADSGFLSAPYFAVFSTILVLSVAVFLQLVVIIRTGARARYYVSTNHRL